MITFKSVSKHYQHTPVLHDINLRIDPQHITCLLGPSGSGKSTLLKMIAGLEAPTSGTVTTHGKASMVLQDYQLFPHMSVLKNLTYVPTTVQKQPKAHTLQQANALLEQLGLADKADAKPHQLSGGQKQRVAIARTLMINPTILVLDEPTAALDSKTIDGLSELIRELSAQDITIVMATHDLGFADRVATQIVHVDQGRVAS